MATNHGDALLPIDWEVLLPAGPALANHAGCIVGNTFYVHGGVTRHRSIVPSNKLYELNLDTLIWNEVRVEGSPHLSHHACVSIDDRFMVLIGGWDGQSRLSSVHVFDTKCRAWFNPVDVGFPEEAGLSSHAALLLDTGNILVVGREGCKRTVEKHGNAYLLRPDLEKMVFQYTKLSTDSISRSGHTLNTLDNIAFILGGRTDDFIEFHKGFTSKEPLGALNSNFINVLRKNFLLPLTRHPHGRKHHISIVGKDCIVMHGGEVFNGKSRTPVADMLLMIAKPEPSFYKIGNSAVARAAHVCVNIGDRVIFHGGVGWNNVIYGDCYELKLQS